MTQCFCQTLHTYIYMCFCLKDSCGDFTRGSDFIQPFKRGIGFGLLCLGVSVLCCKIIIMANPKGGVNLRCLNHSGKHSLLPPKSPFPSVPHSYADHSSNSIFGPRYIQRPKQGTNLHQRTSSESLALEEQPSWLDELLNEPDTPVRKGGHRRSSSDSFAYFDVTVATNREYTVGDHRGNNLAPIPSWGYQELDPLCGAQFFYREVSSVAKPNYKVRGNSLNPLAQPRENFVLHNCGMSQDGKLAIEKPHAGECYVNDDKASDKVDHSANPSASEGDSKRAKQQFAQRSRVRKLQLIAELEKNVQALEADGSEVSAELEFLSQQNLILGMVNKALKQRLDSLAQVQLIKCLEQEMLEREIGQLQTLYQQQKLQPQQPPTRHRRDNSRDLDSHFTDLSLKQKETCSSKVFS